MMKIDRLGWTSGISFESFGIQLGLRVNKPENLEAAMRCLPPGWKATDNEFVDYLFSVRFAPPPRLNQRNFHLLYGGTNRLARTLDQSELLEMLEGKMQILIAEIAPQRVFVHAGVVGWRGKAIVLPGRSFRGKSTLVAALLRAGATYYSDEYAVLDSDGHVHPYPRPLALRQPDQASPLRCGPEAFGSAAGTEPLPIGVVAVAQYRAGSNWQPRPMSAGKAMLEMFDNTVSALRKPEEALSTLERVVASSRNYKGTRGEADETAERLLRECEA